MPQIKLCSKHFKGTVGTLFTGDDTKCDFCRKALLKEMERFGIYDRDEQLNKDKEEYGI